MTAGVSRSEGMPHRSEEEGLASGKDSAGRTVTHETEIHRGVAYKVKKTVTKYNGAERAGLFLATALPCAIAWAFSKVGGSQRMQNNLKETGLRFYEGEKVEKEYGDPEKLNAETSVKHFGVNVTKKASIQDEIDLAHNEGRLLRQGNHQYVFLKNSAVIIIPNGDREQAHARGFWNRDTGNGFENSETLERCVKAFLMGYDAIEKQGGNLDHTLIIDLDSKQVRGFNSATDPKNPLDSTNIANNFYELEGSLIDQMKALWDPEKVDSKIPLQGTKVDAPRKRPKGDEPEAGQGAKHPKRSPTPTGQANEAGIRDEAMSRANGSNVTVEEV